MSVSRNRGASDSQQLETTSPAVRSPTPCPRDLLSPGVRGHDPPQLATLGRGKRVAMHAEGRVGGTEHRHASGSCAGRPPRNTCRAEWGLRLAAPRGHPASVLRRALCPLNACLGRGPSRPGCGARHLARCRCRSQHTQRAPWDGVRAANADVRASTGGICQTKRGKQHCIDLARPQ